MWVGAYWHSTQIMRWYTGWRPQPHADEHGNFGDGLTWLIALGIESAGWAGGVRRCTTPRELDPIFLGSVEQMLDPRVIDEAVTLNTGYWPPPADGPNDRPNPGGHTWAHIEALAWAQTPPGRQEWIQLLLTARDIVTTAAFTHPALAFARTTDGHVGVGSRDLTLGELLVGIGSDGVAVDDPATTVHDYAMTFRKPTA